MAYIKDVQVGSDIYLIEPALYIAPSKSGAAYTATLANFSLTTGATVQAKFAATNDANATLNVNNTGAKEIHYNGDKITANQFKVNHVYTLVYDGTQWQVVGDIDTNTNTWRGIQDNLTSDSTTDSLSAKQGKVLKGLIDAMDATTPAASGNATAFIDSITQTDGKITSITKKNIPTVSSSTAGLAPKGTAVSTQSTSTKFLREDGAWATPSYITNTDAKVAQSSNTEDKEFPIILKNTDNTTNETNGVKYDGDVTVNPSKSKITATTIQANSRLVASKAISQIITGTGTAGSYTNSTYHPAKWTFNTGLTATDGDIFTIKIPVAGHDYGVFMSIDNGDNYYPVVLNGTGRVTTHYPVNTYITVIFEPTGSAASMFALAGQTSSTRITVTGGVWRVLNYYDSNNNDIGYYHRRIYPNLKAGGAIHPYSIIMQLPNGRWSGITTTAPNNPGKSNVSPVATGKAASASGYMLGHVLLMYANATYADGTNIGTYNIWSAHSGLIDARYSFNLANSTGNGFVAYTPVYIVGTVSDGLFHLDTTKWWTQTLPSSDDGKVYIYIGDAYDWYRLTFTEDKPIYWYKNGAIRLYSGASEYALSAPLSGISGADDLKAIEAISSTSGLLKKTAANTWTLDTNNYVTSSGITSVTIGATSPVQSSTSTAQTGSSASTTISLKDAYGDTKNPYGTKAKNLVLAGPSSGNNAAPSFRALVAEDIPNSILKWQTTTAESTALYDFGVYVNNNNANGSAMTGGNYFNILNVPYRKASGNTKADWGWQLGNGTANDGRLWYRTSGDNVWGDWQTIAHATQSTNDTGSSSQPVYMTKTGVITPITAVGAAYGGTGKTTLIDSANILINALSTGSSDLTANDYVITQYVGGGTTTTTYHRRPASKVVNATLVKAALGTVSTTAKKFLKDTGTWTQVAFSDLTGTATNAQLANSSLTVGNKTISLGETGKLREIQANPQYHVGDTSNCTYVLVTINKENSWMLSFTLRLYQGYQATDIQISGYNYGSNHWYSPQAIILGSTSSAKFNVYFGYTGNYKLWVAVDGSSYTGASVVDITNGYTQIDFENAITLTKVSTLPETLQTTKEIYRPWYRNETVSSATTADTFSSGTTVKLTGDTTGESSSSTKGWSVTTTTKLLTGTAESDAALITTPGTGKIKYSYNVNKGTTGLFENSNNANSIITFNKHSGNYDSQLGFSSNGNIYYRNFIATALNNTTAWKQIAFTSSTVARATADASGNVITSTYAPLASPALTGTPTAPTAANGTNTTQIATTAFVNNTLSYVNAMRFKGTLGTGGTVTALPASHNAGDTYRVITAGTWAGKYCEVGTLIICIKDGTAASNDDWTSVETNEDGAVIGPSSSTGNNITTFSGNTGRIIQDSGKAFSTATPESSSTDAQIPTAKAVWAAINALDADLNSTTPGAGKTLTAFSQTNGKVSATFGDISITKSQVSDFAHNHDDAYLKLNGSNNMTADVNIITGDTDKFVNFWHTTDKTAGASWRIGVLGTGSGDTNYFVVQSGTSTLSATTWNNVLQIGQNTYNIYIPSTTASTSTTSGALTVEGGAGIKGQLTATRLAANGSNTTYNLYVNGTSYLNGQTNTKTIVHLNGNAVDDGSWLTGTIGTAPTATTTDGTTTYSGATIGTSILTIGNNKIGGNSANGVANNSQGYLRLYSSGSAYAQMTAYSGDKTRLYPEEGIAIPDNKVGIMFRPTSGSYYTHFSYQTTGNEALVMATQNAVTSFIFINGESYANVSSTRWRSLTPALQIKNNSVIIGKLIDTGVTPEYKFEVNGTSYLNGNTTVNGNLIPGANNTKTLGSTSARWSKLYIGNANSHGDAYTPIYWNDGVPTAVTPIQYCEFTIGSGKKGVKLTHTAFTATSYVTQVVVTSGESNLNSTIAWESAAGYINLTCSATSGAVTGYILVSRGGAITATATDIT